MELATLHGQATVLAALVAISPKLLLGYPARLGSAMCTKLAVAYVTFKDSYGTNHFAFIAHN